MLAQVQNRISSAVQRIKNTPLSGDEKILTTTRLTSPVTVKEGSDFISRSFTIGLSSKETHTRLKALLSKLHGQQLQSAIVMAKETNPVVRSYTAVKGDKDSQSIADILKPKVLMYSEKYYEQCRDACGVTKEESEQGYRNWDNSRTSSPIFVRQLSESSSGSSSRSGSPVYNQFR